MKNRLVWLMLIATLIAAYFAPRADDAVVVASAKAAQHTIQKVSMDYSRTARLVEPAEIDLQIHSRHADQELGNVFASHSWAPPPEPVKAVNEKPAPAPALEAPPLPFRFLGRLVEEGKTAYFLQLNDRNLVIRVGDTVDGVYTLESSSGGTLTFAYLPLDKKQTLAVGEVD